MFVDGSIDNKPFTNASPDEVSSWLNVLKQLQPQRVVIYTISRDTPTLGLVSVNNSILTNIGNRVKELGLNVEITPNNESDI